MTAQRALLLLGSLFSVVGMPVANWPMRVVVNETILSSDFYFYVTFHGGSGHHDVNQVLKYSSSGDALGEVLSGHQVDNLNELRSMTLDGSSPNSALLIANAKSSESRIVVFGPCDSDGKRSYIDDLVTTDQDDDLDHPYGVAIDGSGNVWVSNQHSDRITRYHSMRNKAKAGDAIKPNPFAMSGSGEGTRGIAYDKQHDLVYVADEANDIVRVFDASSRSALHQISVSNPIGLFIEETTAVLYVGSKDDDAPSVKAFDMSSRKLLQSYSHDSITHPAGIAARDGLLFVLCQDQRKLASFDVASGKYQHTLVRDFSDDPEGLLISPC